jgi:helicase SWR1
MAHWEKVAGADDKERKAEEKRLNVLAKATLKAVLAQWKEAVKVCVMSFCHRRSCTDFI